MSEYTGAPPHTPLPMPTHAHRGVGPGAHANLFVAWHTQVVVALDDSRSMAENHCGALALEALTCIARALTRLEVGDLGVVAFGAAGRGVRTLHPLGTPFTDASGPALVSSFSFSGDNTVADAPAGALLDALDVQLAAARENLRGCGEQLQQLVLVIAGERSRSLAAFCDVPRVRADARLHKRLQMGTSTKRSRCGCVCAALHSSVACCSPSSCSTTPRNRW
jgi:hypothetical protein